MSPRCVKIYLWQLKSQLGSSIFRKQPRGLGPRECPQNCKKLGERMVKAPKRRLEVLCVWRSTEVIHASLSLFHKFRLDCSLSIFNGNAFVQISLTSRMLGSGSGLGPAYIRYESFACVRSVSDGNHHRAKRQEFTILPSYVFRFSSDQNFQDKAGRRL